MCGICGELRFDGTEPDVGALSRAVKTMQPRGPDAEGIVVRSHAALGHRRLKIIDLSDAAEQPMVDAELGLSVVFNGAIYNYRELKAELEAAGYRFFSAGDTEVLIKAYHAWGPAFVERLNGMFALAIVERDTGKVFLARDRLGIKPLYWVDLPGGFRFASSLPALLAAGGVDTGIDSVALNYYLSFHAVVPAPRTILRGIRKLDPGTTLELDSEGNRRQRQYWDLSFERSQVERERSFEDWQDKMLEALRQSVKRRLVADVPVGVLLSGGLDSSLVVGLLAEQGQRGLQTFSIGFETVDQEKGDEFVYSDVVAQRFETEHHRIFVDSSRALPSLARCIHAMNEPMVSHDAIGFFLLSEEVKRHVKVVQSGQGADEIFAGYHWYPPMLDTKNPVAEYAKVFCDRDFEEYRRVVSPEHLGADHAREFVQAHFAKAGAESAIDKALRLDTTVMLIDDPVKRVDSMTMAWGLEARVPFLDHEVVELAARVPPHWKVPGGGKYVLKELARRVIPHQVIDRPKGYFPVPALKYLRGSYLELVRDALLAPVARQRGLFQPPYVERMLSEPEAHMTPLRGSKLWQLALLELWLQDHLGVGR